MDFKSLKSALKKSKNLSKVLDQVQAQGDLDQILAGFYEYLITENDPDLMKAWFNAYGKDKRLTSFMDRFEDFDYPFHQPGLKPSLLLHEKVIKSVPGKLTWFYGYVLASESKHRKKLAEALKKHYKSSFPEVLKYEALGETVSDKDFLAYLDSID